MKIRKMIFFIVLSIFYLLNFSTTAFPGFFEDLDKETKEVRNQILQIIPESFEFDDDFYNLLEKSYELTSVIEIEQLYLSWINAFKEKIIKKGYLSINDTINFIYSLHYWAFIYEGLVMPNEEIDENKILELIPRIYGLNLQKENTVYHNFDALIKKYNEANKEAIEIHNKEFGTGTKEIFKLITPIFIFSPDQRWDEAAPGIAKRAVVPYKSAIASYFPDVWYLMIREYVNIQNTFFNVKNRINECLKIFSPLTTYEKETFQEHSKAIGIILKYSTLADLYFKKIDSQYRIYIFDIPVTTLSKYSYYRARAAKHWLDDKEELRKTLLDYAAISEFKYTVAPSTDDWIIKTNKELKSSFDEKEYAEIKARSKLTKEWYNLLPRVKNPEPDKKFEDK